MPIVAAAAPLSSPIWNSRVASPFALQQTPLCATTVGGLASTTVQVRVAGEGSVFPEESVARTWKVWLPKPRLA